jgi:two-component system alkaline phosphatase synthesis response regulator PhoP
MGSERILVAEDDNDILELVEYNLAKESYEVVTARSGQAALEKARSEEPDLIVMDLMLPGLDGFEVCKILKEDTRTQHIPIVILTVRDEESDIVAGLDLGADDYVTKPFSPRVLVARIRAVLRRKARQVAGETDVIKAHGIVVHPGRHEVLVSGSPVELTPTEFRVLHFLARHPGWVFSRRQIADAVHVEDYIVTDRSIDVHIVGLRRKLGAAGSCIETVRGVGYRLRE